MEATDARKLKPEVQQELRKQAIRLCKKGMKQAQVAEIVRVYPCTVSKWWRAYKKDGIKALRAKQRGRRVGSCRTLSAEREKIIQKAVVDKDPEQLKLPFAMWAGSCGRGKQDRYDSAQTGHFGCHGAAERTEDSDQEFHTISRSEGGSPI